MFPLVRQIVAIIPVIRPLRHFFYPLGKLRRSLLVQVVNRTACDGSGCCSGIGCRTDRRICDASRE